MYKYNRWSQKYIINLWNLSLFLPQNIDLVNFKILDEFRPSLRQLIIRSSFNEELNFDQKIKIINRPLDRLGQFDKLVEFQYDLEHEAITYDVEPFINHNKSNIHAIVRII